MNFLRLSDSLAFGCLFLDGFFLGYYFKFINLYDTLWIRSYWYSLVGVGVSLVLASVWTYKKYVQRQYRFDHFYIIFYGLICFVISSFFMFNGNFEIFFHFGFVAHASLFLPCYSYINLCSTSQGLRPARLALANCLYFSGLAGGFAIFNPFDAVECAWIHLGITLSLIVAAVTNEILQHLRILNYKKSLDVVFNLMNDEKVVFLSKKSIFALFVGRPDFYITRNRQWLVVAILFLLVLERTLLYSDAFLELSWNSASLYMNMRFVSGPFVLYAFGGALGSALMVMRYKPQLVYLMFGLIKITAVSAVLGIYMDFTPEHCFLFLCFYYVSMGVYSSVALQGLLECSSFLWTELILAGGAYTLDVVMMEVWQLQPDDESEKWKLLMGLGVSGIILTATCITLVQLYLPQSEGLIDIRNHLLGVRRHKPAVSRSKIWNANHFLQHDLDPTQMKSIHLPGNRTFQQYPRWSGEDKMRTQL